MLIIFVYTLYTGCVLCTYVFDCSVISVDVLVSGTMYIFSLSLSSLSLSLSLSLYLSLSRECWITITSVLETLLQSLQWSTLSGELSVELIHFVHCTIIIHSCTQHIKKKNPFSIPHSTFCSGNHKQKFYWGQKEIMIPGKYT